MKDIKIGLERKILKIKFEWPSQLLIDKNVLNLSNETMSAIKNRDYLRDLLPQANSHRA